MRLSACTSSGSASSKAQLGRCSLVARAPGGALLGVRMYLGVHCHERTALGIRSWAQDALIQEACTPRCVLHINQTCATRYVSGLHASERCVRIENAHTRGYQMSLSERRALVDACSLVHRHALVDAHSYVCFALRCTPKHSKSVVFWSIIYNTLNRTILEFFELII